MQQEVANVFIKRFQLNANELAVLHGNSREAPITEEFFTVINRVQVNDTNQSNFRIIDRSTLFYNPHF